MLMVKVAGWERFAWLRHGFTMRLGGGTSVYGSDGELNLGLTREDDAGVVWANRGLVLAAMGGERLATVKQEHGDRVVVGGEVQEADAMMTAEPGLMLGIMAADCVPVLLVDTRLRVAAAVHAGWRGTAVGIAGKAVLEMGAAYGCRAEDLVAAIGPSIGQCCYVVGEEVRSRFGAGLFEGNRLDLWEANRLSLVGAGVSDVTVLGECTACSMSGGRRKYFSHRGDAGVTGRGMGVVGVV